jgi:hypothetical protein
MIWITVSHKTLCDHCEWRDGLTSKEIEEQMDEREDDPENYGAVVPPLHPFCFCKVAPVTKELLDAIPDNKTKKDFYEWLND